MSVAAERILYKIRVRSVFVEKITKNIIFTRANTHIFSKDVYWEARGAIALRKNLKGQYPPSSVEISHKLNIFLKKNISISHNYNFYTITYMGKPHMMVYVLVKKYNGFSL